jgi:hypothetical protein
MQVILQAAMDQVEDQYESAPQAPEDPPVI